MSGREKNPAAEHVSCSGVCLWRVREQDELVLTGLSLKKKLFFPFFFFEKNSCWSFVGHSTFSQQSLNMCCCGFLPHRSSSTYDGQISRWNGQIERVNGHGTRAASHSESQNRLYHTDFWKDGFVQTLRGRQRTSGSRRF